MPAESWPCGATTTTTSGRIPHWAIGVQQKRAGRLSNLRAPRPARLPNPKPTTINPKDSRYERGTNGGQVTGIENCGEDGHGVASCAPAESRVLPEVENCHAGNGKG